MPCAANSNIVVFENFELLCYDGLKLNVYFSYWPISSIILSESHDFELLGNLLFLSFFSFSHKILCFMKICWEFAGLYFHRMRTQFLWKIISFIKGCGAGWGAYNLLWYKAQNSKLGQLLFNKKIGKNSKYGQKNSGFFLKTQSGGSLRLLNGTP